MCRRAEIEIFHLKKLSGKERQILGNHLICVD
jgi:hypothetical protein